MALRIALAGNPNCGKTTLFNALTGSNQFVGNWPGVTVEKKEGKLKKREGVIITDLPGIYSLSPYTPEELVARHYLVKERPEAILNLIDGTNPERNLYLTTQLTELGIPVVVAVNMMDVVEKNGEKLDLEALSRAFGCPFYEISALKGTGIWEAAEAAIEAAEKTAPIPHHIFSGAVEHALAHIEEVSVHSLPAAQQRWYSIKLFERDAEVQRELGLSDEVLEHIEQDICAAETELDDEADSIITNERYHYVTSVLQSAYLKKREGMTVSQKIDLILTHRIAALPIFAVIMFLVYYISVSTVGTVATDWVNDVLFGEGWQIGDVVIPGVPTLVTMGLEALGGVPEWLSTLLLDGIVAGVGAVLGFVPQLLVLFAFLAFLEACGYLSRVAFVLDRVFRRFGLSGKSFIPMLVGSGCSVPGIMASRTIENEQDRRMTIITTSFIPCGAKLPVIALIGAAFFGGAEKAWWLAPICYFIGVMAVLLSGLMLKKTRLFAGEPTPFLMELPDYHMPTLSNILRSMWDRGWSFIKKAGTVILLSTILIWFGTVLGIVDGELCFSLTLPEGMSLLERFGGLIAPLFAPLGFANAKAAVATLMGLIAKEEIVAVFGVTEFAGMGALAGFSFLCFNLLCAPCFAAMGAIRREMNSAKWTLFAIGYQCALAYVVSLIIYQFGSLAIGQPNPIGLFCAAIVLIFAVYLIVRPHSKKKGKA